MPLPPTRAPARDASAFALALLLSACRIGYEELALLDDASTNGGAEVGGGATATAGSTTMDLGGEPNSSGGTTQSSTGGEAGSGSGTSAGGTSGGGSGGSDTGGADTGGSSTGGTTGTAGSASGGGSVGGAGPSGCRTGQYGDHAYELCDSGISHDAAEADCESRGLRLARIDDAAENAWVHSTLPAADQANGATNVWRWLGADDLQTLGEWRWADGTLFWTGGSKGTLEPGMYANWTKNQPLNPHCLAMRSTDGAWFAMTCSDARPYVCEQY